MGWFLPTRSIGLMRVILDRLWIGTSLFFSTTNPYCVQTLWHEFWIWWKKKKASHVPPRDLICSHVLPIPQFTIPFMFLIIFTETMCYTGFLPPIFNFLHGGSHFPRCYQPDYRFIFTVDRGLEHRAKNKLRLYIYIYIFFFFFLGKSIETKHLSKLFTFIDVVN